MESATYWKKCITELTESVKTCRPEHRDEYTRAMRYAQIKLNNLRRIAGVF